MFLWSVLAIFEIYTNKCSCFGSKYGILVYRYRSTRIGIGGDRKGVRPIISTYEALMIMLAFGTFILTLLALIIKINNKK
ncbi:putative holin-like toxin [Halobacillus mangrovi]|uniref:putative holin-like toxin n=1 Tax=Halobacillus mangrovi TaxID=402384 RepID=UPI003D96AEED